MRLYKTLLIFFLVALGYSAASQNKFTKRKSPETMAAEFDKERLLGTTLFNALKDGNDEAWVSMYPTDKEYHHVLSLMLAKGRESITSQEQVDALMLERKREAVVYYRNEFKRIRSMADSLGINWKVAVFRKFDYDTLPAATVNLLYLNGCIQFQCNNQYYLIEGIEAIKMPAAYKLQAVKGIRLRALSVQY